LKPPINDRSQVTPDERQSQTASGELSPGVTLFGVYEILGALGSGGMGRVYRARHIHLGDLRAIKVIRPDRTDGANVKQQFVREARALMQIHHDAVAGCYELLSDPEGCLYLVMELVEGPSLEAILQTGPLETNAVRTLWQRIAEGLAAIHAKGIIHRDISPGNIVLPDRKPEKAKLIDFGVASVSALETIGTGEFKGKLAYASPEQLGQYGGKVDAKSDIYSFGLVLAEAASGAKVYRTPYEMRIPPNVPGELREDILKLLEPDPAVRPNSAFPAPPKVVKDSPKAERTAPWGRGKRITPRSGRLALLVLLICAVGLGVWQVLTAWQSPAMSGGLHVGDSKINPRDGLKYIWIPPGTFTMGCSPGDSECYDHEKPAHEVTISKGFWLGRTDVTQAAYQRVVGSNPSDFKGDNLPVEAVTWDEARSYCQAISGRLPTEAEWEYAARAGSKAARYGNLNDIAWYDGNSGDRTHKVAQKQANAFGLYDMLGNVSQWTADWYGSYQVGAARDPTGPASGAVRTLRGGSRLLNPPLVRVSFRLRLAPGDRIGSIGLRCVGE
jgi:formylglycine-generating enzyme required for sulfatase activity/tRNA A-37 threonylcarbamoyl transferase component Bud32